MIDNAIEKYTGIHIVDQLINPYEKECYSCVWQQMYANYGDNVDFERMSEQILLCDETREYLYAKPAPVRYIPGTRPELEEKVHVVCWDCKTDRETVLSLMCYIRDLYKKYNGEQLFYGGTEEELIKKGEWLCECVARLMVALCEIKGIPGRTVFHSHAGHFTAELYFEGKWGYVDPRCGLFYLNEKGAFASVDELVHNRKLLKNQSDYVKSFHSHYWSYEYREHRNYYFCLSPLERQCFCNYSLMDQDKYHYNWQSTAKAKKNMEKIHQKYEELSRIVLIK